jgi:NADPH:quinone reductase-like Zn-dependent oxidoreductase
LGVLKPAILETDVHLSQLPQSLPEMRLINTKRPLMVGFGWIGSADRARFGLFHQQLTRTSAKRKQLTAAGAKYVIATEEEDLVKEIDKITGGQGARVVFDPVGGPTLSKLIKAMSFQGLLYLYGALSDQVTTVPVLDLIGKIITIKGHNIWLTSGNPARQKTAVDFVINGLEKGTLKPIIDRVFAFDEIVDAHRYLENSGQFGKIVATV